MPPRFLLPVLAVASLAVSAAIACGDGNASPAYSADSERMLRAVMLREDDIGDGYVRDLASVQTNEATASARPDTENAREQYRRWGQLLSFDVQFSPPAGADLVYTGRIARIMNQATLFANDGGASASLAFTRGLSPSVIANVLVNDGAGAKISETQALKDRPFPAKGDESFAWRLSGKATFPDGSVTAFVADAIFLRAGRFAGNIIAVGLGQQPDQAKLERMVDRFVEHIREPRP